LRENTIALKELSSLGFLNQDIYIDIVNCNTSERPLLDKLIEEFGPGDCISMYSVSDLIKGKGSDGLGYYKKILAKGINLLIYDFSSSLARLSSYSSEFALKEYKNNMDELYEKLNADISNQGINGRRIANNIVMAQRNIDYLEESKWFHLFQTIYFHYEAYNITLNTTLYLLKEYCNVKTKLTFWNVASTFEKHPFYDGCLMNFHYWHRESDILEKPKRCNISEETYFEIKNLSDKINIEYPTLTEEESVNRAINELRYITSYEVYKRLKLAVEDNSGFLKIRTDSINIDIIRNELSGILSGNF